jgi:hypothetical protein
MQVVVNTALAAKDPKGNDVTDISGTTDKRYAYGYPQTQTPYCSCENSCSRWNGKSDVITYTLQ